VSGSGFRLLIRFTGWTGRPEQRPGCQPLPRGGGGKHEGRPRRPASSLGSKGEAGVAAPRSTPGESGLG